MNLLDFLRSFNLLNYNLKNTIKSLIFGLYIYQLSFVLAVNAQDSNQEQNYLFDLGSPNSPVENGYIQITESSNYDSEIGYGWIIPPHRAFYRPSNKIKIPLSMDGIIADSHTSFRIDLADGDYFISVLLGILDERISKLSITLNGETVYEKIKLPWRRLNYRFLRQKNSVSGGYAQIDIQSERQGFTIQAIEIRPVLNFQEIQIENTLEVDTNLVSALVKRLEDMKKKDPNNIAASNQIEILEKYLLASNFYEIGWWSWAVEKTGLSIFNRFHIASDLLRYIAANKDDPLYNQSLYLLGKIHYWLYQEQHLDSDRQEYEYFFGQLAARYPDHTLLKMYRGEKILHDSICDHVNKDAPQWARIQHEAVSRLLEIIHWWVDNRQLENGEMGGKYADDVEMLRWWLPAILGADDKKAQQGYKRLVDGVWNSGLLKNAFSEKIEDVEHSAELFSDTHPAMLLIDYGNPIYVERCMQTMQNFRDTWTGINSYGHRHFKSCYLSADEVIEDPPVAVDVAMNARATLAGLWLGWYNHDPHLIKLMSEWGSAWVEDANRKDKEKPLGILPAAVRFDNDEIGGYSDNWFHPNLGWSYYEWKYLGGIMEMYNQLLGMYILTGNKHFQEPLLQTYELVQKDEELLDSDIKDEGSDAWVRALLRQDITYSLSPDRSFPQLLGRAGSLLDTNIFDEFLKKKGRAYIKYLLSGDEDYVIEGCRNILEDIKYNFPLRTSEVKFTDRVYVTDADELFGMYTGGIGDGKEFPSVGVTWTNTGSDIAILVKKSTKHEIKVLLYNFGTEKTVQMNAWRLQKGDYSLTTGICHMESNKIMRRIENRTVAITERGERINLVIPPKVLFEIKVSEIAIEDQKLRQLYPDLALNPSDILLVEKELQGQKKTMLNVTIHNIGSAVAENIQVEISINGKKFDIVYLSRIDPPKNLLPSIKIVSFELDGVLGVLELVSKIIYKDDEITKRNNQAHKIVSIK
jgi:hypothetical protein